MYGETASKVNLVTYQPRGFDSTNTLRPGDLEHPYESNLDRSEASKQFASQLKRYTTNQDRPQAQVSQVIPLSQMAEEERARALAEVADADQLSKECIVENDNTSKLKLAAKGRDYVK